MAKATATWVAVVGEDMVGEPTTNKLDAQDALTEAGCGECTYDVVPCCRLAQVIWDAGLGMWMLA